MSAGPRYHGPRGWARDRGEAARWAVRTLAQAFGAGYRRPNWCGPGWQNRPQWRPGRRSEPRWFAGVPPRIPFEGSLEPGCWRPRFFREERRNNWQHQPPVQRPGDWRIRPTPRRGPPVALIKVPRWDRPELWNERRPRWSNPRGPLRGGPERSAGDPQRTPHDSPCGGPARSSDDPRLSKTTPSQGQAGNQRGEGRKVAHRHHGRQRRQRKKTWGPLSRTAAWKAGCYWEESKGEAKVFLEMCGEKKEVSVEKLMGETGQDFGSRTRSLTHPQSSPKKDWKTSLSQKTRLTGPPRKKRSRS